MNPFQNTLAYARELDAADELKTFRNEFQIPQQNGSALIYFLGNSLGLQPRRAKAQLETVLEQWQHLGVEAFFKGNKPWLQYHDQLAAPLAGIVGALPHEVVVMNSLTVNLHLMLASFYRPQGRRVKILCEAKAFPSDQYMLETHLRQRGLNPKTTLVEVAPPPGETLIPTDHILAAIDQHKDELALVLWGGVNYYSGQVFHMAAITKAAQAAGAVVGFDLAHAAGNVALNLHEWNVDFACWCSYKYLNSGPGAVGGCFIHERHHQAAVNRFAGWWGNKKETRFLMEKNFDPTPTAEGWQLSTPSPVLFALHHAALQVFSEAGMERLLNKGRHLSNYLYFLLNDVNAYTGNSMQLLTPENEAERGCQISMLFAENGKAVFDFLEQHGIFADWREPNVIRVAPVPLYNRFAEVWQFADFLKTVLQQKA